MADSSYIVLGRGVKQRITDVYREYKNSTLHMNYEKKTVSITTNGKDEGVLIFGEIGEVLCKLADGLADCSFQSIFDKVKQL